MTKKKIFVALAVLILGACLFKMYLYPILDSSPEAELYNQESAGETADTGFSAFLDQVFTGEISGSMLDLHYILANPSDYGITDVNTGFSRLDVDSQLAAYDVLRQYKETLLSFDYSSLSDTEKLSYDVFMDYLTTQLEGESYIYYQEILNPTTGIQAQLPVLLAEYTFRSKDDIENYLMLLSDIPGYFESLLSFEQVKAAENLLMSDTGIDNIIAGCQKFIENSEENYLLETFESRLDEMGSLTDAEKSAYIQENTQLISTAVIPAYENLIAGLSELKGSGTNDGGLSNYVQGKQYYTWLIKKSTGSSRTPDELESLIINRIQSELLTLLDIIEQDDLWEEWLDYSFAESDPEVILTDLYQHIQADFPKLTNTSCTIKYVHESLEESLSPAFYLTPPLDVLTENVIYINRSSNLSNIYPTMAHEGFPGHLYQTVYSSSLDAPMLRRLLSYPGYSEGWATYVEHLSYYYNENHSAAVNQASSLSSSITLGVYAYVDLCVNYYGWTESEVKAFVCYYYGSLDDSVISQIYQAVIAEPANYLKYYVGYLEFMMLREKAELLLGDEFNALEFHTFVLNMGECSFDLLNEYLSSWVLTQYQGS